MTLSSISSLPPAAGIGSVDETNLSVAIAMNNISFYIFNHKNKTTIRGCLSRERILVFFFFLPNDFVARYQRNNTLLRKPADVLLC